MKTRSARIAVIAILSAFLVCCVSMKPERLATPVEAFPEVEKISIDGLPQESFKKTYFEVSQNDVFRATLNAMTKANLNIEFQDKEKGVIIAMKEASFHPRGQTKAADQPGVRRYSVAAVLTKKSVKGTDLTVYAKVQTSCGYWGPISATVGSIFSFFIITPFVIADNSQCSDLAELQWMAKEATSASMLADIIRTTRENLMNAGLL